MNADPNKRIRIEIRYFDTKTKHVEYKAFKDIEAKYQRMILDSKEDVDSLVINEYNGG